MRQEFIRDLSKVGIKDIETVGGKNASLGEMIQHLGALGIKIPHGFVITVDAYRNFFKYNGHESQKIEINQYIKY
jgi:pyruvate,water dikinase